MFAEEEEAPSEIKNAREASPDARFQLDWRWIGRYSQLRAYDDLWWWASAGSFTLHTTGQSSAILLFLGSEQTSARQFPLKMAPSQKVYSGTSPSEHCVSLLACLRRDCCYLVRLSAASVFT